MGPSFLGPSRELVAIVNGDRPARGDYARVWLEICRRSLQGIAPEPETLFDDTDDLADTIARHPAGQ